MLDGSNFKLVLQKLQIKKRLFFLPNSWGHNANNPSGSSKQPAIALESQWEIKWCVFIIICPLNVFVCGFCSRRHLPQPCQSCCCGRRRQMTSTFPERSGLTAQRPVTVSPHIIQKASDNDCWGSLSYAQWAVACLAIRMCQFWIK